MLGMIVMGCTAPGTKPRVGTEFRLVSARDWKSDILYCVPVAESENAECVLMIK